MSETEFTNLIHRYLTGECTPAQSERVETWISASRENRKTFEAIRKIWEVEPEEELRANIKSAWQDLERKMDQKAGESSRHLQKHTEKDRRWVDASDQITPAASDQHRVAPSEPSRPASSVSVTRPGSHNMRSRDRALHSPAAVTSSRLTGSVWFRAAAFLMVALLLSLFAYWFAGTGFNQEHLSEAMKETRTERGQHSKVAFSDGTEVWLNASSSLTYPIRFDENVREVYLDGEAWFEVRNQEDAEFIVHTPDAIVRVLGTEFNVRAYDEEEEVEVVVGGGVVSVHTSGTENLAGPAGVRLEKNEMSRVPRGGEPTPAQQVDVERYTSWLRGDFIFVETPFYRVLAEWERQYNVDFNIENDELKATPLTGEFRDETFEEMLRLTSMALDFGYKYDGGTITIIK